MTRPMSDEPMRDILGEARVAIDAADHELLALVNRRLELVRTLHEYKVAAGLPLKDAEREESMIAKHQAANGGPLSDDGVASLFHHILALIHKEIHGV